jgi:hypothetical protein
MPQLLVLMAAGAGLYAGYKWLSREVGRAHEAADRAQAELRRNAQGGRAAGPKDLGELVWDEKAGAYRPK